MDTKDQCHIDAKQGFTNMRNKSAFIETIIFFIICDAINYLWFPEQLGWFNSMIHPYWIPIILLSSRYGFIAGVLSGFLATAHYLYFTFGHIPTRLEVEKFAETPNVWLIISFILAGFLLGALRQKYIDTENTLAHESGHAKNKLKDLKARLTLSEKARKILEMRITNETDTIRMLYHTAEKLDVMDSTNLYQDSLDILKENFKVTKSSFYIRKNGFLELKAHQGWLDQDSVEAKINEQASIMKIAIDQKTTISIRDILIFDKKNIYSNDYGKVLAMFPLKNDDGSIFGVINVEEMDFLSFHKETYNSSNSL